MKGGAEIAPIADFAFDAIDARAGGGVADVDLFRPEDDDDLAVRSGTSTIVEIVPVWPPAS